jgi:hypothetical protein
MTTRDEYKGEDAPFFTPAQLLADTPNVDVRHSTIIETEDID